MTVNQLLPPYSVLAAWAPPFKTPLSHVLPRACCLNQKQSTHSMLLRLVCSSTVQLLWHKPNLGNGTRPSIQGSTTGQRPRLNWTLSGSRNGKRQQSVEEAPTRIGQSAACRICLMLCIRTKTGHGCCKMRGSGHRLTGTPFLPWL